MRYSWERKRLLTGLHPKTGEGWESLSNHDDRKVGRAKSLLCATK